MRTRGHDLAQLPLVLITTAAVIALPVAIIGGLQIASGTTFPPLVSALFGGCLSLVFGWVGSRLWILNPRSKDVLFSDLVLWGWVQRLIQERRLANATRSLRFDSSGPRGPVDAKSAEQQIATLKKLAVRLEAQDPYTHGHTRRVARHSYMIAKTMGLPLVEAKKIRTAAAVHDVGKMHIPADVLHKPGKLSDEEFDLVKQHSVLGAEMVAEAGIDELTALVRHHHERIDGRGYPDRLAGDEIPLGARIMAVADTFDAITSARSYRDASAHKNVVNILKKASGTQLDPDATAAFLRYYNASKSRRFVALLASSPDKLLAWLAGFLRQAGSTAAISTVTAASVAVVAAGGVMAPPRHQLTDDNQTLVASATIHSEAGDDPAGSNEGTPKTENKKRNDREKTDGGGSNSSDDPDGSTDPDGSGDGSDPDDGDPGNEDPVPDDPGSGDTGSGGAESDNVVNKVVDKVTDTVDDTVDDVVDPIEDTVDEVLDILPDSLDL